ARIRAIVRKADSMGITPSENELSQVTGLEPAERDVIFLVNNYVSKLNEAARDYSPAVIANFAFDLAKGYNQFYQSIPIFNESDAAKLKFRIAFSQVVADLLRKSMRLLGIQVPEKM
ncbi:MAG TPA: DALR anticodon-binding domain-containing protein, partial [Cyclobacteriaceae bacterium]|nr:DALR anticodon-binding domain-containing protein [Cyclobacteriaceae bacterium]